MKSSFLYHLLIILCLLMTANGFGSSSYKTVDIENVSKCKEHQKLDGTCFCVKEDANISLRSNNNYPSSNQVPDWSKKDNSVTLQADWFQLVQFGLEDLRQLYIRNVIFSPPLYLVNRILRI